jgi:hypothetical protein
MVSIIPNIYPACDLLLNRLGFGDYTGLGLGLVGSLWDTNGVFQIDSRGGCQSGHEGAVGSLFGHNRLSLGDGGRLDDCVWGSA